MRKYDWNKIQEFYNKNHTWREVKKEFGVASASIHKAVKRGDLKLRNKSEASHISHKKFGIRKHTEETKKKISEKRIQFLIENPDKVPYVVNHSSKKSWPEEVFENALKSFGIKGWIYKYRNSIYEYDFAFPDLKLDVEVDGGTHKTEKVKKIDERRDEFSRQQGWKVLRFEAERVKKNVVSCIEELKTFL